MLFKEEDLKTKLYYKRYDFTFPIVNFLFISSNIQASPAFHNSYVTLELVPNALNFWTEAKATLLLGWNHRYKKSTFAITIWLSISQMIMDLLLFTQMFCFLRHCQDFCRTRLYISATRWEFITSFWFCICVARLFVFVHAKYWLCIYVAHLELFCACSHLVLIVYICCPSWVILCLFTPSIDCVYVLPVLSYFVFVHA